MEQSFYDWLMTQLERRGPVGALAQDALNDEDFPRHAMSKKKIKAYLTSIRVAPEGLQAFEQAFDEYMEDERVH